MIEWWERFHSLQRIDQKVEGAIIDRGRRAKNDPWLTLERLVAVN